MSFITKLLHFLNKQTFILILNMKIKTKISDKEYLISCGTGIILQIYIRETKYILDWSPSMHNVRRRALPKRKLHTNFNQI